MPLFKKRILYSYAVVDIRVTTSWKECIIPVCMTDMSLAHQQVMHQSKEDYLEIQIRYLRMKQWPLLVAKATERKITCFKKLSI